VTSPALDFAGLYKHFDQRAPEIFARLRSN